jgi:hypothetical protein
VLAAGAANGKGAVRLAHLAQEDRGNRFSAHPLKLGPGTEREQPVVALAIDRPANRP